MITPADIGRFVALLAMLVILGVLIYILVAQGGNVTCTTC